MEKIHAPQCSPKHFTTGRKGKQALCQQRNRQIGVHTHMECYFSHNKEWTNAFTSNVDGPGDDHTEWKNSEDKKPMIPLMGRIWKSIQRTSFTKHKDSQTVITRTNFWSPKGKGGLGGGEAYIRRLEFTHTHSNILHVFYKQKTDKDLLCNTDNTL